MASRNRIHGSSLNRQRGPTQDHRARPRRERHEAQASPKRSERRAMYTDKEPWNVDTDNDYGSGRRSERRNERKRYAPQPGRESSGARDLTRRSYWDDAEYEEPRLSNNYDNYDRTYPGAWD